MFYSFDVYDTLITRVCAEPSGIFVYMQKILSDTDAYGKLPLWFAEDFVRVRKDSEILARKQAGNREISLDDIYKQMSINYHISDLLCQQLSELEMKVEIRSSVVIQENIDRIDQLAKAGNCVLLISDMYMDRSFYEKLFSHVCPLLNQYPLYISSECGATKSSGKLFVLMAAKEHLSLKELTHTGDHAFSDVSVPELLGAKTNRFQKKTDPTASSRIHAVLNETNSAEAQFLIGIQNQNAFLSETVGYQIGYSLAGMILYEYIKWVIDRAAAMQIETLHFIARDGYLLKQIADILIQEDDLSIRTNYLYGSRTAWRTTDAADQKLVDAYFQQEVLRKGECFAFVDAQGTGLSLDMVSCLRDRKVPIFYYTSPMSYRRKYTQPHIYMMQRGRRVIEVLCRAPHGLTTGYTKEGNKVRPLTAQVSEQLYVNCGFYDYNRGVIDFVREILRFQSQTGISLSLAEIAQRGMQYCENTPDRQLAVFLGEIPFGTFSNGDESKFAPRLSEQDVKQIEFERGREHFHQIYSGTNIKYSYQRLDKEELEQVRAYQEAFYRQPVNKASDAVHIVIYGCGYYGTELYRALYFDEKVVVDRVVDPNSGINRNAPFKVDPVSTLSADEFDYVVITKDHTSNIGAIKTLLALAGLDVGKVLSERDFWTMRSSC